MKPEVSVIISTYNRSNTLPTALDSLLEQERPPSYEIIVVDNNCSDNTRDIVENYAQKDGRVRYILERNQGLSHGRNAGIRAALADILAFTDDDVCVARDWIANIKCIAQKHPECGVIGGKVLPRWPGTPPSWLHEGHWAPLALVDYGRPQVISSSNRRTLIGANMVIRRQVFEQIGLFAANYQRVKDGIGSTEDQELQDRYWQTGGLGYFHPDLLVKADIQPERLCKRYHRRWHLGHGKMLARMRDPEIEGSSALALRIPRYMFRECASLACKWLGAMLRGKPDNAFLYEVRICFYLGFIRERLPQRADARFADSEIKRSSYFGRRV